MEVGKERKGRLWAGGKENDGQAEWERSVGGNDPLKRERKSKKAVNQTENNKGNAQHLKKSRGAQTLGGRSIGPRKSAHGGLKKRSLGLNRRNANKTSFAAEQTEQGKVKGKVEVSPGVFPADGEKKVSETENGKVHRVRGGGDSGVWGHA